MAKKDIAATVAGAGLVTGIWTELVRAVAERGGNAEHIHRLATPEGRDIIGRLADVVVGAAGTYQLMVNYRLSVEQMVAAGQFDGYINSNITSANFPHQWVADGTVTAELVHYNRRMTSQQVLDDLESRGLRPATMAELLTFAADNPDVQRKFPIVALGSVWAGRDGYRRVGCLDGGAAKRGLNLDWFGGAWNEDCRFLAVRK